MSGLLNSDMTALRERIVRIVATSTVKDEHVRVPVAIPATMTLDGCDPIPSVLVDLSTVGALIRPRDGAPPPDVTMGSGITIAIEGVGVLKARALMPAAGALHVQFIKLTDALRTAVGTVVKRTAERDQRMAAVCSAAAAKPPRRSTRRFTQGASTTTPCSMRIPEIPGTDPIQHTTRFLALADKILPSLQEPVLKAAPEIVFCVAVDRNGCIRLTIRLTSMSSS